ncbi:MAG: hypothetical protein WDN29_00615 [Methylovirgula sp.]
MPDTPIKALFFDVFGTLVDFRSGVAREAERLIAPKGKILDWGAFADAWRGEYQAGMEEIRSGREGLRPTRCYPSPQPQSYSPALWPRISQ